MVYNELNHHLEIFDANGNLIDSIAHMEEVTRFQFTNDGKNILIATSSDPFNLLMIDRHGKILYNKDSGNETGIERIIVSAKAKYIVTQDYDSDLTLWDSKGNIIRKLKVPYKKIDTMLNEIVWTEFSPDDKYLAICYRDNNAYIYNLPRGSAMVLNHDQLVTFASFSADGLKILTGSADNTAKVWDLDGNTLNTLIGHTNDVTGGRILDDNRVITTSLDGTIRSWKLENYNDIILKGHVGPVNYLDADPTEKYLVSSGAEDKNLILWNLTSKKEIDKVFLNHTNIRYVQFINDHEVLGITQHNDAFIYKLFDHNLIYLKGHHASIEWAEVLFDHIVTASQDSTLQYWNKDGKSIKTIRPFPSQSLLSLRVSEVDSLVAVGSKNGSIFLYNSIGDSIAVLKGHDADVTYLDISKDGRYMVSASKDKTGIIWDLKTKRMITHLTHIACAPYNVDCNVISANFSYDGTKVVTTSSDRTVRVWDLDGHMICQMIGHTDALVDAYFSPDDRVIYSFSADHTLRLWDLMGNEIATYRGHTDKINSGYMDRDNKIYTASDDGTIHIWLTPIGVYRWMKESDQFKSKIEALK